jgi:rapamycin-insensitive companion of mTOR
VCECAPALVSRAMVQSLICISEHKSDDFRRVCIDALRDVTVVNPAVVASCSGVAVIVQLILDPTCRDVASSLSLTLLYLMDHDATRRFLRPQQDLLSLLAVFTDTATAANDDKEATRSCAHRSLITIMRSWPGILCLTSDPLALRALVQLLGMPQTVKGSGT